MHSPRPKGSWGRPCCSWYQLRSSWCSGGLPAPYEHRVCHVTCWYKLWEKGHSLVPWLLDAHRLPTLRGGDGGGRHPVTI